MRFLLWFLFLASTFAFRPKIFSLYQNKVINKSILIGNEDKCSIFVVVFPGYDKHPQSYVSLCNKIQEKAFEKNTNVQFLIIDYLLNLPFTGEEQSEIIISRTIEFLKEKNKKFEKLYFMGHSAGGYFSIPLVKKYGDGFIQMGSVLNSENVLPWKSEKISTFEKPILTLLGEKDGFTNPFLAINEYSDLEKNMKAGFDFNKSIVIEEGVDHLQMCDGILSNSARIFEKKHIKSSIPLEEAHERLSNTITNFITWEYNETSYQELYEKLISSKMVIDQYNALKNETDYLARRIQYDIVNTNNFVPVSIQSNEVDNVKDFILCKPSIDDETGKINIYYALEPILNPITPYYSKVMALKLKNQNAIRKNKHYSDTKFGVSTSACIVNRKIMGAALKKINKKIEDVNIIFIPDKFYSDLPYTSVDWIKSTVSIKYDDYSKTLSIRSPVLYTENTLLQRYDGMYYMKVLTPQLAQELVAFYFK